MAMISRIRDRAYRTMDTIRNAGTSFPKKLHTAPKNRRIISTANRALYRLSDPYRPLRKRVSFVTIVFRFIDVFLLFDVPVMKLLCEKLRRDLRTIIPRLREGSMNVFEKMRGKWLF